MFAAWYLVGVLGIIAGVSGLAMLSGGDGGAALPPGLAGAPGHSPDPVGGQAGGGQHTVPGHHLHQPAPGGQAYPIAAPAGLGGEETREGRVTSVGFQHSPQPERVRADCSCRPWSQLGGRYSSEEPVQIQIKR